jgi:hypothetical protein
VVAVGAALAVNVNGANPPVWWPAGYIPTVGDAVKVLMVDGTAVVHSPVITTQRPLTGTVSGTAANGTVAVVTTAGTLQCRYVGTAPASGALVRLDWQATTPWVWPSAAATTPDVPTDGGGGPTAPPTTETGTLSVVAQDSGTWSGRGVWDSYYATHLTQGTYNSVAYSGAWFYGGAPAQIAGRRIGGFRLRLGSRRRMGNYNAALTLQVYRTTNNTRPGGDTTRVEGPATFSLAPGAGAQWVTLPAAWGQSIVDGGGGLAIAGGSYGGVTGVGEDAASGQLQFDWQR